MGAGRSPVRWPFGGAALHAAKKPRLRPRELRELRVVHTSQGAKGVYPAARMKDLIEWMRLVSTDDAEFIMIAIPR